jgi:uncharacterized protein
MERKGFFSTYTGIIIVINVIMFLLFLVLLSIYGEIVIGWLALQPASVLQGRNLWTFITSMFLHSPVSLAHIFANMISLVFIGSFVEKLIGKKRFLGLYFGAGIFAGLFYVLVAAITGADLNTYALGASGAIFGLGGLLAILTPRLPVLVFFIIPMPMWAAMIFLLAGLWVLSLAIGLPIGNIAHLGGLLVGLGYGFYLKWKYPYKTKMISRYFSK